MNKKQNKLTYYWRLFATGISFTVFGIGGIVFWALILPLIRFFPGSQQQKIQRSQQAVHFSFYFFIGLMHKIGVMTYDINGLEKLNKPGQLIIANHPTLVDIVFLLSRLPTAYCIVKEKLWHNPFMKSSVINAGYISNADPEKMIDDCVGVLQAGGTLIVFPEGTRTVPGSKYKFHRGTAIIALQAKCIVTPVTLSCYPSTLSKAEKWYQIPEQRFHLAMHVGDDMVLDEFAAMQPRTIAARHFTHYLEDYFSKQRDIYEHYGK